MAKEAKQAPALPVGELASRHKVPAWVLAGCRAAYGWEPDKELTEQEFEAAVAAWLRAPMGRRQGVK